MYVPVHLVLPGSHGSGHDKVAELLQLRRRLNLEGQAGGPLGHTVTLSHAEKASEGAPKCAKCSLADALVRVVDKLEELGNSLLEVGDVLATGVGDDVAVDLSSDLLLHSDSGDTLKVIPVIIVDHSVVQVFKIVIIILAGRHDLDLLALNNDLLANKLAGVLAKLDVSACLILVEALVETLNGTREVLGKALLVDLGHGAPQDVASLAETRMVKVKCLLRSLHQRQNVGLERLGANSRSHLAHRVTSDTTEVQLILAVLNSDIRRQLLHSLWEERQEGLLSCGSNGANGSNGSALSLKILVVEELAKAGNQLRDILSSILGVKALNERVDGVAATTNDGESALVIGTGGVLDGKIEVLDHSRDELGVLLANILGQVIGQAGNTVKRGSANLELGVLEEVKDHRQDLVQLGSDEVRSALNAHTQSKDTGLAVVGILGREVVAKVLEERNDNLARRKAGSQDVEQTKGGASGCDILVLAGKIAKLSDNVQGLQGKLLTDLESLDLELPVADTLHQEGQRLGTVVILDVGGGRELEHKPDKIAEVLLEQSRLAAEQGLEDLEGLHGVLLVTLVDGLLQDSDHGGDGLLESSKRLGILLRLKEHSHAAQTNQGVDPDIGALGVLDGLAKQVVEVSWLTREGITSLLECCPDDKSADFPVLCGAAGGGLVQVARQISPLAIFEVLGGDRSDDAGGRVPCQLLVLVQCELQQLVAERGLLILGKRGPVLDNKLPGLDGSKLLQALVRVPTENLKQSIQGSGRVVVVLVQCSRGILDNISVS